MVVQRWWGWGGGVVDGWGGEERRWGVELRMRRSFLWITMFCWALLLFDCFWILFDKLMKGQTLIFWEKTQHCDVWKGGSFGTWGEFWDAKRLNVPTPYLFLHCYVQVWHLWLTRTRFYFNQRLRIGFRSKSFFCFLWKKILKSRCIYLISSLFNPNCTTLGCVFYHIQYRVCVCVCVCVFVYVCVGGGVGGRRFIKKPFPIWVLVNKSYWCLSVDNKKIILY